MSAELAERVLRKFVKGDPPHGSCVMIEDSGIALIDSSWVSLEPDEIAYLRALREEYDT